MHRLPAKPFAPAQSLKPLQGSWAREKNGRSAAAYTTEYHPARLQPGHGGISPWDHASPKLRSTLSNVTVYDELVITARPPPPPSPASTPEARARPAFDGVLIAFAGAAGRTGG